MKTLNEVCEIVGLSRRVIQEYEKNGLAKTPKTTNKYGHLLYSDEDIERLWQIRFYRELEYKKSDIKNIFDDPNYDKHKSMQLQIQKLEEKKRNLENLISIAKYLDEIGMSVFSRNSNSILLEDMTFDTALPMFGSAFKLVSSQENMEELVEDVLSEDEVDSWFETMELIMNLSCQEILADSCEIQELVSKLYELTSPILSPSIIVFEWISISFMPGNDIANDIDEMFGKNKSSYLFSALQTFIRNNKNNPYDLELVESIENIGELAVNKYNTSSVEVQQEVDRIYNFFKRIKLYNEKGQLNFMKVLAELYGSDEYKRVIDNGNERGLSWFISRSIQIYIENIEGGKINGRSK